MRYMTAGRKPVLRERENRQGIVPQRREKGAAVPGVSFGDVRIRYRPAEQGTPAHTQEGKASAGAELASGRQGGIVQRATDIQYHEQTYNYYVYSEQEDSVTGEPKYESDGTTARETVGGTTIARLDPADSVKGSTPSGQGDMMINLRRRYGLKGNELVRGHLLNHDLGGVGMPDNLFPITAQANGEHKDGIEKPTKEILYKGYNVVYTITAVNNNAGLRVGKEADCADDVFDITVTAGSINHKAKLRSNMHKRSGSIDNRLVDNLPSVSGYDQKKVDQTRKAWHH